MTREMAFIVCLVFMSLCLTASDYAGLSFDLTRLANDKFKNPTTTICDWQPENEKFCKDANSRCFGNCCQCTCEHPTSTFVRNTMKCRNNDEIRKGCEVKFDGNYRGAQIKVLDLKKKGQAKIYYPVVDWSDKVKSFDILSIASYHDGSGIKTKFLQKKKGEKPKKRGDGKWESTIQWNKVSADNHGKLFKVNISYEIESLRDGKNDVNDCFVFKSSGTVTVTFPSSSGTTTPSTSPSTSPSTTPSTTPSTSPSTTPSTTPSTSPSTAPSTAPSTTPSTSPSTAPSSSAIPSTADEVVSTEVSTKPSRNVPSTATKESEKTREPTEPSDKTSEPSGKGPTPGARNGGDEGGSNAITVSLVVVGCLVLLVAGVLLVIWSRRRSAKAAKEKNGAPADANRSIDNPMAMSQMENIYAEADNTINYSEKGKNNFVYDYAEGNLENNYTSLDMSKVESKPTYESLINTQNNVYEQIPVGGLNGHKPTAEPLYHVAKPDGPQDPGQIYQVLDEPEETGNCKTREIPGRTGDEDPERVYSTLEDGSSPENYARDVPGRSGDDDPERVYSVLEDDTAESDYIAVLPEKSDYEQPINPPAPDA